MPASAKARVRESVWSASDSFAFLILPYGWDSPDDGGTIAPNILSHYDVEFDFAGGKIAVLLRLNQGVLINRLAEVTDVVGRDFAILI